ncbi:MAG: 3-dehydroquinate synthase, partial [Lentisphaeria bacterium]|nr:3-dehydroquinate synthase [Lentisphaeria bacterium]
RISHGEAVSIGMECAGLLALELGMWSKEQYLRQAALLDALHLPRRLPENTDIDSVIELMKSDKKNRNGKITFVLPFSTGSVKVVSDIPVELIRKVISEN